MKTFFAFALLLASLAAWAQQPEPEKFGVASDHIPSGLKTGEKAPDFTEKTADGKSFNLYNKLKEGPVVLVFYRGYWCPVCSRYLSAYQDSAQLIIDRGASFVAVTPETYEFVEKTREKTKAGFTILSDTDGKIMEAFGVNFRVTQDYQARIESGLHANIAKTNTQEEAVLPVPATYIIDRDGFIVYRQFDLDYGKRASIKDMLANLPE